MSNIGYIQIVQKICEEIDSLYDYANSLIPKDIVHNLGYKKELVKGLVEELITMLVKSLEEKLK